MVETNSAQLANRMYSGRAKSMRITIVCVGKVKEKFFTGAIDEYSKRLSRYCKLDIVEVPDERTPDGASDTVNQQIKEKEGRRILDKIPDKKRGMGVILCVIDRKTYLR